MQLTGSFGGPAVRQPAPNGTALQARVGTLITPTPSTSGRHAHALRAAVVVVRAAAAGGGGAPEQPSSSSSGGSQDRWWDRINKGRPMQGPTRPAPSPMPAQGDWEGWGELRMGKKGYREFETIKRDERQRVWDNMRRVAQLRYQAGQMPEWFDPSWLNQEEAPTNAWWRQQGLSIYQVDDTWAGGGGDDGGGSGGAGGGGGGGGWWRPDDPYWPMRDWGDHPMRWWTWAFGGLLAAGGMGALLSKGSYESAAVGMGAGAALAVAGMAMSDMKHGSYGALGVKAAWATCLLLALKEWGWGWQHKPRDPWTGRNQGLGGCGWAALGMCGLYMWTGMSGLDDTALPMNPGAAFKLVDVAQKHKVWERWGYGDLGMR